MPLKISATFLLLYLCVFCLFRLTSYVLNYASTWCCLQQLIGSLLYVRDRNFRTIVIALSHVYTFFCFNMIIVDIIIIIVVVIIVVVTFQQKSHFH